MNNEQPHHDDCSPSSGLVVFEVVDVLGQNNGDNEVGECHTKGTDCQNGLTADAVNVQDCWDCCELC